jgi:hypothetical protein
MIYLLLNEEFKNLDKQTYIEFLLYRQFIYDSDIHPLHNRARVEQYKEEEKKQFEEFLEYKNRILALVEMIEGRGNSND